MIEKTIIIPEDSPIISYENIDLENKGIILIYENNITVGSIVYDGINYILNTLWDYEDSSDLGELIKEYSLPSEYHRTYTFKYITEE